MDYNQRTPPPEPEQPHGPRAPHTREPVDPNEADENRSRGLHQSKAQRAGKHSVNEDAAVQPDPKEVEVSQIASSQEEIDAELDKQTNPRFKP